MPMRAGAGPLQVALLAARELALGNRIERELHRGVAVDLVGLDLDDRTRTSLDHRHGRDVPRLRRRSGVIPSFLPRIPFMLRPRSRGQEAVSAKWTRGRGLGNREVSPAVANDRPHHKLDLDVDACGKVEPHQRVHRLRRGAVDVDQALVRAHLEVLARVLVLERAADHAVDVLLGGQGTGPVIVAPARCAVSTIWEAERSTCWWS